ncbi:MAG: hypothetical protein KF718_28895 [Polyangiaceae bacterium]|nr:hypothetical protein [Polyangiaceae bacterium]
MTTVRPRSALPLDCEVRMIDGACRFEEGVRLVCPSAPPPEKMQCTWAEVDESTWMGVTAATLCWDLNGSVADFGALLRVFPPARQGLQRVVAKRVEQGRRAEVRHRHARNGNDAGLSCQPFDAAWRAPLIGDAHRPGLES